MAKETLDGRTHYLPYFTEPSAGGLRRAVCGAWIHEDRHAVLVSCPKCEAWFQALSEPTAPRKDAVRAEY